MGGGIDQSVSPGMGGFLAFFLLACALWLLMRNMLKHMRGLSYREEREEKQERLVGGEGAASRTGDGEGVDEPATSGPLGSQASDEVQTRPSSLSAGYPREPQA